MMELYDIYVVYVFMCIIAVFSFWITSRPELVRHMVWNSMPADMKIVEFNFKNSQSTPVQNCNSHFSYNVQLWVPDDKNYNCTVQYVQVSLFQV